MTFETIARCLNSHGIATARGKDWNANTLWDWTLRFAPFCLEDRNWICLIWPYFLEPLLPSKWRLWHLDQPVGFVVRKGLFAYYSWNFTTLAGKDLESILLRVPSNEMQGLYLVSTDTLHDADRVFKLPGLVDKRHRLVVLRYKQRLLPARRTTRGCYRAAGKSLWFPEGCLPDESCLWLTPRALKGS